MKKKIKLNCAEEVIQVVKILRNTELMNNMTNIANESTNNMSINKREFNSSTVPSQNHQLHHRHNLNLGMKMTDSLTSSLSAVSTSTGGTNSSTASQSVTPAISTSFSTKSTLININHHVNQTNNNNNNTKTNYIE